jgi:hypothetical protein
MMLPESVTFMPPIRVLLWALALLASCAILGPGARAQDTASADAVSWARAPGPRIAHDARSASAQSRTRIGGMKVTDSGNIITALPLLSNCKFAATWAYSIAGSEERKSTDQFRRTTPQASASAGHGSASENNLRRRGCMIYPTRSQAEIIHGCAQMRPVHRRVRGPRRLLG